MSERRWGDRLYIFFYPKAFGFSEYTIAIAFKKNGASRLENSIMLFDLVVLVWAVRKWDILKSSSLLFHLVSSEIENAPS